MQKQPTTIVIRKSPDHTLEAEVDGHMINFYQNIDGQRRTLYDVCVDDLQLIVDMIKNETNRRE